MEALYESYGIINESIKMRVLNGKAWHECGDTHVFMIYVISSRADSSMYFIDQLKIIWRYNVFQNNCKTYV